MRALDPEEQEQFKGMSKNEALLKVVEARNRKREEYKDLEKCWPKQAIKTQLKKQRNTIQDLAQRIAKLKQQQTKKSN